MTDREATLIIAALAELSYEFEGANPEVADEAWELAIKIADDHELDPTEATRQLR